MYRHPVTGGLLRNALQPIDAMWSPEERRRSKRTMRTPHPYRRLLSPAALLLLLCGYVLLGMIPPVLAQTESSPVRSVGVLADPNGNLSIEQAASATFTPERPNNEISGNAWTYWVKVVVHPAADARSERMLLVEPGWDVVDLYLPRESGFEHQQSGNSIAPFRRPVQAHFVAFPVSLPTNRETTLYIRIHDNVETSAAARHLNISVLPTDRFVGEVRRFNYKHGIYAGIILAMVAYNFVLFFSLREKTYLFYSIYVAAFGMLWMQRAEFFYDWLWPNSPYWNWSWSFYLVGTAVTFSALFVRSFFDTHEHSRLLNGILLAIAGITVLLMGAGTLFSPQRLASALALDSLATTVFFGGLGLYMLLRGYRRARFFLLAWTVLLATNMFYILVFLGIVHASALAAEDAVQVGSAVECILLAFALADRVRSIKQEHEQAQWRYTLGLEEAVVERTQELVALNARLEEASITDPLTGLSNRRLVDVTMERLTTELKRAVLGGDPGSLLICIADLDRFKKINDTYGHEIGDAALKHVSEVLLGAIRGSTILARWGGEEFLLVDRLRGREEDGAFAERMRQLIANDVQLALSDGELRMTMSLGLAHFPFSKKYPELLSWQEVLTLADRCLYQAKEAGRNCWFIARANEEMLDKYVRQYGELAAAAFCLSQFEEAVDAGLLELWPAAAECSSDLR